MNQARIKRDIIVIGASVGGVQALQSLCARLPSDLPAIVGVVIHRSPWYSSDIEGIYTVLDRFVSEKRMPVRC